MAKELQIVGFQVGRETFGVPIHIVHEIVRVPEITPVPDAPACVEGVMNLRGKIISVVDMRKRFGEAQPQSSRRNRVLVAEVQGKLVGLVVDSASEVLKVPAADIAPPGSVFQEGDVSYITGLGRLKGRLIMLIDLARVLDRGELKRVAAESQPAETTA